MIKHNHNVVGRKIAILLGPGTPLTVYDATVEVYAICPLCISPNPENHWVVEEARL